MFVYIHGPFSLTRNFTLQSVVLQSTIDNIIIIPVVIIFYFQVDVYSFGVLLCEMCICKTPDPERRDEQVLLMTNDAFRNLVHECLKDDPAERPDMASIIQKFEGYDQTY